MSAAAYIKQTVIPAAYSLLPTMMEKTEATLLLLAIGEQESGFRHRRQIGGPAVGLFQFEDAGIHGVLNHPASRTYIRIVLDAMAYDYKETTSYIAIPHNDILAVAYARLLLWTHPKALPAVGSEAQAWQYYLTTWRPGRPRLDRWVQSYEAAMTALA